MKWPPTLFRSIDPSIDISYDSMMMMTMMRGCCRAIQWRPKDIINEVIPSRLPPLSLSLSLSLKEGGRCVSPSLCVLRVVSCLVDSNHHQAQECSLCVPSGREPHEGLYITALYHTSLSLSAVPLSRRKKISLQQRGLSGLLYGRNQPSQVCDTPKQRPTHPSIPVLYNASLPLSLSLW